MGCLTDVGTPSIDGDQVVFHASFTPQTGSAPLGEFIYRGFEDCLSVVADKTTPAPGGTGTFQTFGETRSLGNSGYVFTHGSPSFDAGEVAFYGVVTGQGPGIFLWSGDSLSVVADTNTPIPGGTGNFGAFDMAPSLRNGSVAFSTDTGIYLNDGNTIRVVMDRDTPMPGMPDTVNFLQGGFSVGSGNVVAFRAGIPFVTPAGVYVHEGGSLRTVADHNTRVPGRAGTFGGFGRVSAEGGDVVFVGGRRDLSTGSLDMFGVYRYRAGMLSMLADSRTAVPGGTGNFDDFNDVVTNGADVHFMATAGGRDGIYRYSGGSLSLIADENTPIPGRTGNFVRYSHFATDTNDIAFVGIGAGGVTGVYLYREASISVIADLDTPVPGGTGSFAGFLDVAADGGEVALAGSGGGQSGIYLHSAGSLEVVADRNMRIPPADSLFFDGFSEVSLDSGDIVFVAGPNHQVNGVYLHRGGSLSAIADWDTPVPGRPRDSFSRFSELTADSGHVTFVGETVGRHRGVYDYDGSSIHLVVDNEVAFPDGTGNFRTFDSPWADEGTVAFAGTAPAFYGPEGVYQYDGNRISVVADYSTPIPGGTGTFEGFGHYVSADGSDVLFSGWGTDPSSSLQRDGLYLASGSSLTVVVDTQTPVPDGAGNFASFWPGMESLSGGDVAFLGYDQWLHSGVYLHAKGSLTAVADENTPIPGGTGSFTGFWGPPSLHGGNVAFLSHTPRGVYLYNGTTLEVIASTSRISPLCSGNGSTPP
jgi:hypothetical protein